MMFILVPPTSAQRTNGTVRSLVNTEDYFSHLLLKNGINYAFINVAAINGITFKPKQVNIKEFYNMQTPNTARLERKADFAIISKSGYFGVASGSYTLHEGKNLSYGNYLSVWKADKHKKWQLALDASIKNQKPTNEIKFDFSDPENYKYPKLIGPKKIKMREDIVFSTDELFGKALRGTGNNNFKEFYSENVRLYFPGSLPILSKQNAIKFIEKNNLAIVSKPSSVDRAISGDLAYTLGKAKVGEIDYNYIRVWQIDAEMKWNIIVDMYLTD